MRFAPASLAGRLLFAAAVAIVISLAGASLLTRFALDHFMHRQIDQQLDAKLGAITDALRQRPDGAMESAALNAPPFDHRGSGWYWQVNGMSEALRSQSLEANALPAPLKEPTHPPPVPPAPDASAPGPPLTGRPRVLDIDDDNGETLHIRSREVSVAGHAVTILASAPQDAIDKPLRDAMMPVLAALALAGIALLLAMLVQIRLGLRPLARLRDAIADVRAGRIARVPSKQPQEVAPLVHELNGLITENSEGLARARRHVANLAHGLKTPLASLELGLAELPGKNAVELTGLVLLMDRRIRHHLARARMAALGDAARARTMLAPRLQDICEAMTKIHADKPTTFTIDCTPDLAVACEGQDVDELFGNLIDNAFKWARQRVAIRAIAHDNRVEIAIDDDGVGLPDERLLDVIRPGHRLDEAAPGYGFGLPIAKELAELYGGTLTLVRSSTGGLRVKVDLQIPR